MSEEKEEERIEIVKSLSPVSGKLKAAYLIGGNIVRKRILGMGIVKTNHRQVTSLLVTDEEGLLVPVSTIEGFLGIEEENMVVDWRKKIEETFESEEEKLVSEEESFREALKEYGVDRETVNRIVEGKKEREKKEDAQQ